MIQQSIFDGTDQSMLNESLELIRDFQDIALRRNPKGYAVGYSGGKDSDALVQLFKMSGAKFFVFHNHTTLDAPQTVYYVRKRFKQWEEEGIECVIGMPERSFWGLCLHVNYMLPQRQMRFCCKELKEHDSDPAISKSVKSFGVRRSESVGRAKNRDSVETRTKDDYSDIQKFRFDNSDDALQYVSGYEGGCKLGYMKTNVNPLAYWSETTLRNFIESEVKELNPLYDMGMNRVGCIGCPMATYHQRQKEFAMFPKYEARFRKLCDDLVKQNVARGKMRPTATGELYFEYYLKGSNGIGLGQRLFFPREDKEGRPRIDGQ